MNQPVKTFDPDEIVIDLRTSCSKDEAAAKLLGWLRGPIYPKYIKVTSGAQEDTQASGSILDQSASNSLPYRIEEHELKNLHSLDCTLGGSLQSQLMELHEAARLEFSNAMVEPDLEIKANAVLYWEKQIRQAAAYLRDIDDELANGDVSELRLDKKASKKAGSPRILLSSLNRWAKTKYKFSIFDDDVNSNSQRDDDDPGLTEEPLEKTKAKNIVITLALMTDFIAASHPIYRNGEDPNYISIAKDIVSVANKLNNKKVMYAQSEDNIRKLLSFAQHRKFQRMSAK